MQKTGYLILRGIVMGNGLKRVLSLFMCIAMCISLLPTSPAYAQATAPDDSSYEDVIANDVSDTEHADEDETHADEQTAETGDDDAPTEETQPEIAYYSTVEEMGQALRAQLKNRVANCIVGYVGSDAPDEADVWAEALKHTGVPDEGDYLKTCINYNAYYTDDVYNGDVDYGYDIEYNTSTGDDGKQYKTYTYKNVVYRTTAAQERAVDEAIEALRSEIRTDNVDNTLIDIFNIVQDIPYDGYHLKNDPEYVLEQTAYGALVLGTSVCEGFAHLFYRLALEYGIDARMVYGVYNTTGHAWNRVRTSPSTEYYNLDATNDVFMVGYTEEYTVWEKANDNDFEPNYPLSRTSYMLNIDYSFDQTTGTLTINDTGVLPDVFERKVYLKGQETTCPWPDSIRTNTKKIVFKDGTVSIGSGLFKDFSVEQLELPDTLKAIGDGAFEACSSLKAIDVPDSLGTIGDKAFSRTSNMKEFNISSESKLSKIGKEAFWWSGIESINIPVGVKVIKEETFYDCNSLESVTIAGKITSIGESAFYHCGALKTVEIVQNEDLRTIGARAFDSCNLLESFELPKGLTELGENAFNCCFGLKEINIPDTLTVIPDGAFGGCNITSIAIPESVEYIGSGAFSGLRISSIYIPERVAHIGEAAFNSYTLKSITVSKKNEHFCSVDGVLFSKDMTRMMCYPDGKEAKEYAIPEGVKTIDEGAFRPSGTISQIYIPSTLNGSIAPVLNNYGLSEFNVSEKNSVYCSVDGVLFSKDMTRLIKYPQGKLDDSYSIPNGVKIIEEAALGNRSLSTIFIPDSVEIIGKEAFHGSGVKELEIPDSVKTLGERAFRYSNIEKLTIGRGLSKLPYGAFEYCNKLKEVYLKNGIKEIGSYCFNECTSLEKVYYSGSTDQWGNVSIEPRAGLDNVEIVCTGEDEPVIVRDTIKLSFDANGGTVDMADTEIEAEGQYGALPDPVREGYEFFGWFTAPEGGVQITSDSKVLVDSDHTLYAHWEDTVVASGLDGKEENIIWTLHKTGELVFYGRGELTRDGDAGWTDLRTQALSVTISGQIDKIGDSGLFGLGHAVSISFGSDITSIGDKAFYLWMSLETIDIPEGVVSLGENCFGGCSKLRQIRLPDSLETIGSCAFGYQKESGGWNINTSCMALESITIPKNVKRIGSYAFSNSGVISVVDLSDCDWGYGAFEGCDRLKSANVNSAEDYMFNDCSALTDVVVDSGRIGQYAFSYCTALKNVTISEGCSTVGDCAFIGCSALETIEIPRSAVYWGTDVFHFATSLKSVVINSRITRLPDYIFYGCTALEQVTLPESLLSIGEHSFFECTALTDIALPESIVEIGAHAFERCSSLEGVVLPGNLKLLGQYAFANCDKMQSITVPVGVSSISAGTFSDCAALESVRMYDTVSGIKNAAFNRCSSLNTVYWMGNEEDWQSVTVEKNNDALGTAQLVCSPNYRNVTVTLDANGGSIACDEITVVYGSEYGTLPTPERENYRFSGWYTTRTGGRYISSSSFVTNGRPHTLYAHWSQLDCEGTCGDNVSWKLYDDGTILISGTGEMSQFDTMPWSEHMDEILGVAVADGIESICDNAFSDALNIRSISLADSVKSIGNNAFKNCAVIKSVDFGNGLLSIGDNAFSGCSSLISVKFGDALASIGDYAFAECPLRSVAFPNGIKTIGDGAFARCKYLTSVFLPNELEAVGGFLFEECTALRSVELPNGVKSIGESAFSNCEKLAELNIPDTVAELGSNAFYKTALTSVKIPEGVKELSAYVFAYCKSLKEIILPETLEIIGQMAFIDSGIEAIIIPNSVTTLGRGVFRHCKSLESVKLSSSLTELSGCLFWDCPKLKSVDIPEGVTRISDSFRDCTALESVTLPESLEFIDDYAFIRCESLKEIQIPDKVWVIGRYAFAGCTALQTVTIPQNVKYLYDYAFENCSGLKEIIFLGSPAFREQYPQCKDTQFIGVTATAYYPDQFVEGNPKWSESDLKDYGGSITWKSWYTLGDTPAHEHNLSESADKSGCLNYTLFSCECGFSYRENCVFVHTPETTPAVAPTCTDTGLTEGTRCSACGEVLTKQETVSALGHDFVLHEGKEATCTEKGWYEYNTCTRCDYSSYIELDARGHSYSTIVTDPTCLTKGYATHICYYCGYTYTDSYTDALGHDFGEWTVTTEPTCTATGTETRRCQRGCSAYETREVAAKGHRYYVSVTEPTCTQEGFTKHTCGGCGDSYKDNYTAALGHDYGQWVQEIPPTCTSSGTETGICSRCGEKLTRGVDATGHSYTVTVTEPICEVMGYTTHTCVNCGSSYSDTYIDALGHDYGEWTVTTEPTCITTGAEARTCSRCGKTETRTIAPTGHSYVAKVLDPTCTVKGYTTYTCTVCGGSYIDNYTDALGHDIMHHDGKAATCTANGWDAYDTCSRCDYSTYKEIAALGHDITYSVTKVPTCTEKGIETGKCSRCDMTETRDIDALGHDRIHHDGKAATCTEDGWEAYDTCSRCDYSTYKEIAATGHKHNAVVTAPTCTAKGYTTHTCACGDSYKDSYTNALGHNYANGKCTRCGATDPNYNPAPAAPELKITTSAGKPKISWDAVDGAVKYWVYRSTDGKTFKYYDSTTKTTYTNNSTTIGTTYYYKVKAVNVVDGKNYASAYSVAKSIQCKPAAPTVSINRSNGKPKLSWKAVSGATKYWIYRSTDGVNFKYWDSTTKTSYTNSGAESGKKYYYRVKAVAVVNGKNIVSANSSTKSLFTSLAKPSVSITTSNGKPKLTWKAVTGADKYYIYRSTDGKNFSYWDSTTKTTYVNSGAKKNTKYYYKVKAVCASNSNANSAQSSTVSIKATK